MLHLQKLSHVLTARRIKVEGKSFKNRWSFSCLAIFLILGALPISAQIPAKGELLLAYFTGSMTFKAIQHQDEESILELLPDTTHLGYLLQGYKSHKFSKDSINWTEDILYNQETKLFEFHVYGGKYRPDKDPWGRYTYAFVLVMEMEFIKATTQMKVVSSTILLPMDKAKLKQWWQNYSPSFRTHKYARKEISDKYGLVPPPPPPPETEEWFKKG